MYLSIIVPAYNEAKRITKTLKEMDAYLRTVSYEYEILVVDDGSKDETAVVVENLLGSIRNLRLIENQKNKGKGGVVRQGMLEGKGEIRIFTDADNSTSIDQFEKMRPLFESGADVVIGSRAVRGAKLDPPEPWYRQIPGKMGNIVIQLLLLPGLWDTQCGFKAFTAEATEKVFPRMKTERWAFDVEVLALARKMGFKIKEIPVHWVNDPNSHVKASAYLQFLGEVFKIRLWLFAGRYKT